MRQGRFCPLPAFPKLPSCLSLFCSVKASVMMLFVIAGSQAVVEERLHYSPCCAQVDDGSVMCFQVVSRVQMSGLLISIMVAHNLPVYFHTIIG